MEAALPSWKREPVVRALMCMRGLALITGMTLVAEAGDMTRFDSPSQLMSYFGLTPSEYSSGEKRHQGGITKAGNGACRRALVEAAQHYRVAPRVTPAIQKRQEGQSREVRAIALKAQQRLNGRFRLLTGRRKRNVVIIAALARELTGFVWAIACQVSAPERLKKQTAVRTAANCKTTPGSGRVYALDSRKCFKR
jgi:transposase